MEAVTHLTTEPFMRDEYTREAPGALMSPRKHSPFEIKWSVI